MRPHWRMAAVSCSPPVFAVSRCPSRPRAARRLTTGCCRPAFCSSTVSLQHPISSSLAPGSRRQPASPPRHPGFVSLPWSFTMLGYARFCLLPSAGSLCFHTAEPALTAFSLTASFVRALPPVLLMSAPQPPPATPLTAPHPPTAGVCGQRGGRARGGYTAVRCGFEWIPEASPGRPRHRPACCGLRITLARAVRPACQRATPRSLRRRPPRCASSFLSPLLVPSLRSIGSCVTHPMLPITLCTVLSCSQAVSVPAPGNLCPTSAQHTLPPQDFPLTFAPSSPHALPSLAFQPT